MLKQFPRCARLLAGIACIAGLMSGGCGYNMDGFTSAGSRSSSILGDGTGTLKIEHVDQVTLYPWVNYYIRGKIRDEVNLRRLAKWVDDGPADHLMTVSMTGFKVTSSVSNRVDNTLISNTSVKLEVLVRNGRTGALEWRSGVITYADKFQTVDEDSAIRDGLKEAMKIALDKMQQQF